MKGGVLGVALAFIVLFAVPTASAETVIVPAEIPEIEADAKALSFTAAVEGADDAYALIATLEGCDTLPTAAVPANVATPVSFSLVGCELNVGETELTLTADGAEPVVATVPVVAVVPDADIGGALARSGLWALAAAVVVGIAAAWWANEGWKRAGELANGPLEPGKVRPTNAAAKKLVTPLEGTATEDLDWTGGIAGKLVFVGAAVTAVLGASDLLDSVLSGSEKALLTTGVVLAALLAGVAPLVIVGFQADFVPAVLHDGEQVVVGDRALVASRIGVILASAVTGAAVTVELVALWDAVDYIDIRSAGTTIGLAALGVGALAYCAAVAGSVTLRGRYAPIIDDPFSEPSTVAPPGRYDVPARSLRYRLSRRSALKASVLLP